MRAEQQPARPTGVVEATDKLSTEPGTMLSSSRPETTHSWAAGPGAPPPATLSEGSVVDGRYRVDALLASGGMGSVYRATVLATGEVVALKAMLPHLASKTNARLRFQREAKAILRLDHPNVVRILDHGELPPHTPYLVMDFLVGGSLRELMDSGEAIDTRRALLITRGVLEGLDHAHSRGVIHRDIKPENVFIVAGAEGPAEARLLDLGLAKLVSSDNDTAPHQLTMRGAVFGTPAYMAPEQAMGEEVDLRADIYSTTVMLYELLTGKRPFYARDPPALLVMHTRRAPRPVAALVPELAAFEAIQALIDQGMAKPPGRRFQSAAAYIEAIDAAIDTLGEGPLPTPMAPASASAKPRAPRSGQTSLDSEDEDEAEPSATPAWVLVVLVLAIAATVAAVFALSAFLG